MKAVGVINYGCGNIQSIFNALELFNLKVRELSDPQDFENIDALVLPGVGAFDEGMRALKERSLITPLNKAVQVDRIPVLGVCLGFQLFFQGSEEGVFPGLGWLPGSVTKFDENLGKVPHIGWNQVFVGDENPLFSEIEESSDFYFVHSYRVLNNSQIPGDKMLTNYNGNFLSGIVHANMCGVQFHPEKSQAPGLKLLENFVKRL